MIGRIRRRLLGPSAPRPRGKQIFRAGNDLVDVAKTNFSRLPFDDHLSSTASQEALRPAGTQCNPRIDSFLSVLGRFPRRSPMKSTRLAAWDCGDYIQEYVAFQITQSQAVPAFVLVPKGIRQPRPAVIAIHGHGGNFFWGKSKVTEMIPDNPTYGFGVRLVRQGYVVLAPDLPAFEERDFAQEIIPGPWPAHTERLIFGNLLLKGATLMGWNLFELTRAIDYLQTRTDVEPERIGVMGHSMGGSLAPLVALIDRRVKVVITSCGVSTWSGMMARHVIHNLSCYAPGLVENGDLDVLLCEIAPRPFMIIAGDKDDNFPVDSVRTVVCALETRYGAVGAIDAFQVLITGDGHQFTIDMQDEAIRFLKRWVPIFTTNKEPIT